MGMRMDLGWEEIGLRLALTFIAGIVIGIDRGRHGRAAGLRTTMLVALAASVSMIQTNLLLTTAGKTNASFANLDFMRLPLGILTGMGFIGAGAILKKDDVVLGVTTAATLWFTTVIGLCLGGGQIGLGLAALAIGFIVLSLFKHLEDFLQQEHRASLTVSGACSSFSDLELAAQLQKEGLRLGHVGVEYDNETQTCTVRCEVRWQARPSTSFQPAFVKELARRQGISLVDWTPTGKASGTAE
jgi:putative Mg2+ transporter-C (MgtC) family protein